MIMTNTKFKHANVYKFTRACENRNELPSEKK